MVTCVRGFVFGAFLAATMLAGAPQARSQAALWCLPVVAESLANLAEACGRPFAPEVRARVDRMSEASLAAVERVKGPDVALKWRAEFRRMSAPSPPAVTPERCAAQLAQFKELLDQLSAVGGDAMVRRVELEAATSADPLGGYCL